MQEISRCRCAHDAHGGRRSRQKSQIKQNRGRKKRQAGGQSQSIKHEHKDMSQGTVAHTRDQKRNENGPSQHRRAKRGAGPRSQATQKGQIQKTKGSPQRNGGGSHGAVHQQGYTKFKMRWAGHTTEETQAGGWRS